MSDITKPLITTIIPTYRRPKLLRRAIKSVMNQTYPHFQVCVYDNASGDETASVVAELAKKDPRVKYHCHSENIGGFNNLNYGMEHVNTPYFSFLSDDDILLPEFFQTAMDGFEKYPDAVFSAGSCINMNDKGKVGSVMPWSWERDGYFTPPEGLFQMMGGKHITWTSIVFRKEVIENIGSFDKEVEAGDLDFELRIAAHFPYVVSKKPCAIFVIHDSSYCGSATYKSFWPGWSKMIRNITEDEQLPFDVRKRAENILTDQIKYTLRGFLIKSLKKKNFDEAYEIARIFKDYYQEKKKFIFFSFLISIIKYIPLIYYLIILLNKIRLIYKLRRIRRQLQKQFGDYAKLLEFI